ncbi:hypothetical protein [Burkholderia lata]|nr:hypothetical protein [Burkholderia lata]
MRTKISFETKSFRHLTSLMAIICLGASCYAFAADRAVCAIVYDGARDASGEWFSSPQKAYCARADLGKICDVHINQAVQCSASDEGEAPWYQAAIDFAANRDASGATVTPGRAVYSAVAFTRGSVNITKVLSGDAPMSNMGVHLQSGVGLYGTPSQYGTTLLKLDPAWQTNYNGTGQAGPQLNAMIAANWARKGRDVENPDKPSTHVVIDSIAISGVVDSTNALPACSAFQSNHDRVRDGITVFNASVDRTGTPPIISRNTIRQLAGNAISFGLYDHFTDSNQVSCSGNALCKLGLVLSVQGESSDKPALVTDNTICGVGFGGITLIGKNIEVARNTILSVDRPWDGKSKPVGSTMGISAGFVGTSYVSIHDNVIEGGDYGIGSDGSFPLYFSVPTYVAYWSDITRLYPAFRGLYPNGPANPNGSLALRPGDDILANQVILDLASKRAAVADDRTGFVTFLRIYNNRNSNSIVGISLFKVDRAEIYGNTINETSANSLFGVLLDSAINSFVYSNSLNWWPTAILVRGAPGDVSHWGSSYNGIGIQPPGPQSTQWQYPGNRFQGNGKNVSIENAGTGNNVY